MADPCRGRLSCCLFPAHRRYIPHQLWGSDTSHDVPEERLNRWRLPLARSQRCWAAEHRPTSSTVMASEYPSAHGEERSMSSVAAKTAFVSAGMGSETRQNRAAERLGVVAVQLVEAARSAWDGDRDGAKTRTRRALILLGAEFGTARALLPRAAEPHPGNRAHGLIRGGLAPFQARRLVEYIDTDIAERMSLHQLARMAGLSNRHFSRAFKQTFGLPTHTYVIRRRIEVAQSVMLRSQLPLSDIALACGLSD